MFSMSFSSQGAHTESVCRVPDHLTLARHETLCQKTLTAYIADTEHMCIENMKASQLHFLPDDDVNALGIT